MSSAAFQELLATGQLPTPTGVALKILDLVEQPDTSAEELAQVLSCDPALSGRLLKIANSPLVGASRRIASVSRAVVLLGFRTAASISLGVTLLSNSRTGDCEAFEYNAFWSNSLARGAASRHLARVLKSFPPDEAFTCGLLSQVGRVALASAKPELYAEVLQLHAEGVPLADTERELFGIDHDQLTAELMELWHMPELFRQAALGQDDPARAGLDPESRAGQFAAILQLAGTIAAVITDATLHVDLLAVVTRQAYQLGVRPDRFYELFDQISEEWSASGEVFEIPTRASMSMADIYTRVADSRSRIEHRDDGPALDHDARGAA